MARSVRTLLIVVSVLALAVGYSFPLEALQASVSLDEMCQRYHTVVEAHVQSVFTATQGTGPLAVYTDVLMRADHVFKGSNALREFIVSQYGDNSGNIPGGIPVGEEGQPKMRPGDRYVLFLSPTSADLVRRKVKRDSDRYEIRTRFAIAAEKMLLPLHYEESPPLQKFRGMGVEQFRTEIESRVRGQ